MAEKRPLKLLSATQAAERAGVRRERIYAAIRQGWLTPVPDMPMVCLTEADVDAFRDRDKPKGGRGKSVAKLKKAGENNAAS